MSKEYSVNVWFRSEADVNVEADNVEEAKREAKEIVKMGAAVTASPTEDEIESVNVLGTIDEDNRQYIVPLEDNE